VLTDTGIKALKPVRDRKRPISDNNLNAALRRLGDAGDQMTALRHAHA